jgi:predicted  nucleic acid-binding Zn-ribbon protein
MDSPDDAALARLLELQDVDSALDRLRRRLETLPEATQLEEVRARLAELEADMEIAVKQGDELAREQGRLEGEIGLLDDKLGREEGRLFSGKVANPKELSSLQAEVEMLKRRRSTEEDRLLEILVAYDAAKSTLESLRAERDEVALAAQNLTGTVEELESEIENELSEKSARRAGIASSLPSELVTLYEGLRTTKGGVGAAALERDTCLGCHTTLPAREVERLRSAGGLQRCDNCRRILVVR